MIKAGLTYTVPDFGAPLDTAEVIRRAPEMGVVKGLYFQDVVALAQKRGCRLSCRPRYVAFKDYPLREYMQLIVDAATGVYPKEPVRQALRLLGRTAYPALADTIVGRAIFGIAGRDFGTVLSLASRAYAVSMNPGQVRLIDRSPTRATLELREIWNFTDSYQVGVFEGAMVAFDVVGEVRVRTLSACDADFEVTWSSPRR